MRTGTSIGRICQREVDLALATDSVQAAAQRMEARNVGSLLVLDEQERPRGILTDRDVALRVVGQGRDPFRTSVAEVMTENLTRIRHDEGLEDALSAMSRKAVRRLPVVDDDGRLLGVVSFDDVLLALTQQLAMARELLEKESPRVLAQEP